ncbi:MAG: class I SAM-dependent methyltransferase [Deltaproteobacteria bacterium]|nr:class I SAM-dependent methyltransferase [Deltaproteobacteria bacterium]
METLSIRCPEAAGWTQPGCGDGCNLLPYHLLGKKVIGCDYDEASLEAGRRSGIRLVRGGTEELLKSEIKADLVIILSHVLEHFIDVDAELRRIEDILREGGYVYIEVPGIRNLNRPRSQVLSEDGFRSTNDFLGYLQFQHNYHFELHTLKRFFERQSFQFITGDEWIRAIFRYVGKPGASVGAEDYRSNSDIMDHLKAVEKDYQSIKNKIIIGGKTALPRLKNLISI